MIIILGVFVNFSLLEKIVHSGDYVAGRDAEHVDKNGGRAGPWHSRHIQVLHNKVALSSQGTEHSLAQTTLPVIWKLI